MRRYFRSSFPLVPGYTSYFEYESEWVVRQIDLFEDNVLLLRQGECSDLPLAQAGHTPAEEIQAEVFNTLWDRYLTGPHKTKRQEHPLLQPPWFAAPEKP